MIHREGFASIVIALLVTGFISFSAYKWIDINWLKGLLWVFSLVLLGIVLQFFRNPSRTTVQNSNHVIAPADGKVVIIEEIEEPEFFRGKRLLVSIFMSPFNVHVNRYPISGEVIFQKYHPGKYLVAWHSKSSTENERTTVVVQDSSGNQVMFRQIAGAMARRIVCYAKTSDKAVQGGEMGFIKFGSRVDVYLPLGTEVPLKLGQKVVGGESIIAKFTSK
jgi:phosphatidylserine decarboxylase